MSVLPEITQLEFNTEASTANNTTDLGSTYQFDFETGEFVLVDGKLVPVSDVNAIKEWVQKCLRTERFKFKIYARDDKNEYGVTIEDLIGSVLPRAFIESELKREISEALTRHPRISSITDLSVERDGAKTTIAFELILTDGQTEGVTISG